MRILFIVNHDGVIRNFESTLHELTRRGHEVQLGLLQRRQALMSDAASVAELVAGYPKLGYDLVPADREHRYTGLVAALCSTRDYLRYLEPEYDTATKLRDRAAGYAPGVVRARAVRRALRRRPLRRALAAAARWTVVRLPPSDAIVQYLRAHDPDVIVFSPLVGFGLSQHAVALAAARVGVPTGVLVHSWDNLTNKGLIHVPPDLVAVWNDDQAREAVELHGIAEERVAVTGAHSYDHWFAWRPTTSREDFCTRVRLRADLPIVLYVCSSGFIAPDEAAFVHRWIASLRESPYDPLRRVGVLVRPHPQNPQDWSAAGVAGQGQVAVFPSADDPVAGVEARSTYFDSIHHAAAVVGINTSAMIESAIQRRPVLTVLAPEFRSTQEGTLHFSHLTGGDGAGLLLTAQSEDEHRRQLLDAIEGRVDLGRTESFLRRFVRPHGLERAAAPLLADAIERLAVSRA
jgi:hypothetical protein